MKPRVLIIEDDPQMARALRINLNARQYEVRVAADGRTGLAAAGSEPFDVLLLDLGLPDMEGVDVISAIRGWSRVPIVVLSARDTDPDKVAALDAGADDYVVKPFSIEELLARLRAALRRSVIGLDSPIVETAEFTVDLQRMVTLRNGEEVHLTRLEWGILETLVRQAGRLVTSKALLEQVWGPSYVDSGHYLRVYMSNLRRKLEADPANPKHFITETGMGYRFLP